MESNLEKAQRHALSKHTGALLLDLYRGELPLWSAVGASSHERLRSLLIDRLRDQQCGDLADILEQVSLNDTMRVVRRRLSTLRGTRQRQTQKSRQRAISQPSPIESPTDGPESIENHLIRQTLDERVPSTPDDRAKMSSQNVSNLPTTMAYDKWSEVYDTDGNFLQALDTMEMRSLLPQMLSKIKLPIPWKIVDLGCGTGRNTSLLLPLPTRSVVGLDASSKMLDLARFKLAQSTVDPNAISQGPEEIIFEVYDMLKDPNPPKCALNADGLISTLVLEHIPPLPFFKTVYRILRLGGVAIITNMHPEMGQISQAGFVDPSTGQKIRPISYVHKISDVLAEAKDQGFEIVGDIGEQRVDEELSKHLGVRAHKWIGVMVWFCFAIRKIR